MRWDETSPVHRPERVSPWKIEPALAHAPDHLPVSQMKRPRVSISSSTASSHHATEGIIFPALHLGLFRVILQAAKFLNYSYYFFLGDQVHQKSV